VVTKTGLFRNPWFSAVFKQSGRRELSPYAATHQAIGSAKMELQAITAGIQKNACSARLRTLNAVIKPTPRMSALTIEDINAATFMRFAVGTHGTSSRIDVVQAVGYGDARAQTRVTSSVV
jgi:hypothetical protein